MRYDDIAMEITDGGEVTSTALSALYTALSQVYPMMLLANLSRNTYVLLGDDNFLYEKRPVCGKYDDMIEEGAMNIHPRYQGVFKDVFGRESLMNAYANGMKQVSVKLYQKDPSGEYRWVNTKVIRLQDESGDVVQICLNEFIPE